MKSTILLVALVSASVLVRAQQPDYIYKPNIHTVKLYKAGDIFSYPIITLNSGDQLELHFDDLDADYKNFYYSFQLCNADWTPANLPSFDYIRGFQNTRISNYRNSSISFTKYTHYQASLPDRNSIITRSGNYLLKVFLNQDTSNLYFTKRFLVVDNKVAIAAHIRQPFRSQLFLMDQRVWISLSTERSRINVMSQQEIKVAVLQNNSWPTSVLLTKPTIFRGNYFEYNDDYTSFQAGREWRWIDLRSLRLMSDRMQKLIDTNFARTEVYVKPDAERKQQVYVYYKDLNGIYTVENTDGNNPFWQSDYAYVTFTYVPPGNQPYPGKDIYLFGELTNYWPDEASKMEFNREKGVYQKTLRLKQGFYNYSYIMTGGDSEDGNRFSLEYTEGNFVNTENNYTILVYYRPFGGRADQLIGYSVLNSAIVR